MLPPAPVGRRLLVDEASVAPVEDIAAAYQ